MSRRNPWINALRAGLVTHLVATFAVLLILIPWHAAHSEFPGHHHPAGTPDHVHGLEQVVGWMTLATALVVIISARPWPLRWHMMGDSWQEQVRPKRHNAKRAPPAAALLTR